MTLHYIATKCKHFAAKFEKLFLYITFLINYNKIHKNKFNNIYKLVRVIGILFHVVNDVINASFQNFTDIKDTKTSNRDNSDVIFLF